jgi:uncharacterized repeat protein (TIGR03803 family)
MTTTTVTVSASAALYDYAGNISGNGATPPVTVSLDPTVTGQVVTISNVSGAVEYWTAPPQVNADGTDPAIFSTDGTNFDSFAGLAGVKAPVIGPLMGVFLNGQEGAVGHVVPTALDFGGIGTAFTSLSPSIDQPFFIGDGLTGTGSGATQQFVVPTGATGLALGVLDAGYFRGINAGGYLSWGTYGDNSGAFTATITASAPPDLTTLVTFNGANGAQPLGGLAFDSAGNLYGTTHGGGWNDYGTAYELNQSNGMALTTLVQFTGGNGFWPAGNLLLGNDGTLYGTTFMGGANGWGTAFALGGATHQALTILANFQYDGTNGIYPVGNLVQDAAGNIYGVTNEGGTPSGFGTVYELSGVNHTTLTYLLNFDQFHGVQSTNPNTGLMIDAAGNLYGTGGSGNFNYGNLFELSGADHQTLSVLAGFGGANGAYPAGTPVMDGAGNIYGTTTSGGAHGQGTIYELSADHQTFTTLHDFNSADGASPSGALLIDAAGQIFGTTAGGGADGMGTVFRLSADHQTLTTLATFNGAGNGSGPVGSLTVDALGNLYGTTNGGGGSNQGTVFEVTNAGFVICFYPGTHIATPAGPCAVESLAIGDLVLTDDGHARPVRWIGRQTVSTRFADPLRVLPIRIRAGALGDNLPLRDLLLSPDHAIRIEDILVQATALVGQPGITRESNVPERFTYHHVELADHSLILAEGVPAETFVDNVERTAFDNWHEHEALYGHLPAIEELPLPRAKSARQLPMALRRRLAA